MKDFSKLSEWISNQSLEKTGEVLQAAINRGSTINSIITGLAQRYNSIFQSVFMYHYDENQQLVDDTTEEAQAIANSVIDQAKADLEGYKKYFEETKSGVVVTGDASLKTKWLDLNCGILDIFVDPDTGEFKSAKLNTEVLFEIEFSGSPGVERQNISMHEIFLGCGYTLVIIVNTRGIVTQDSNGKSYDWTITGAQCELNKDGVAIAHTTDFSEVSGNTSTYTASLPSGLIFSEGPCTIAKGGIASKVLRSNTMGVAVEGFDGTLDVGPYVSNFSFGTAVEIQTEPTTAEMVLEDGVDMIQKIYSLFLNIDEAMKMMP